MFNFNWILDIRIQSFLYAILIITYEKRVDEYSGLPGLQGQAYPHSDPGR
jgi:hypothetical protein